MERTPQFQLKIYSFILILLAVIDAISISINFATGTFNTANMAAQTGLDVASAKTGIIVMLVIAGIILLVKLYLGLKGLAQLKGISKGKGHIRMAWVSLFVLALLSISSIVSGFRYGFDWIALGSNLGGAGILFFYIKAAKSV